MSDNDIITAVMTAYITMMGYEISQASPGLGMVFVVVTNLIVAAAMARRK